MTIFCRNVLLAISVLLVSSVYAVQFKKIGKRNGEYIVKLRHRPSIFSFGKKGFLGQAEVKLKKSLSKTQRMYLLKQDGNLSEVSQKKIIDDLSKREDVAYVEPNYVYRASFGSRKPRPGPPPPFLPLPPEEEEPAPAPRPPSNNEPTPLPPQEDPNAVLSNDPHLGNQWNLHNPSRASSRASYAWNITVGSREVIVAVVDSGVDYNHKDLKDNMWSATEAGQLIRGYDAIDRDYTPMDDNSHGTHVAGVVGASSDNGLGVAGVNWDVQIMPIKFLDSNGEGTTADAIAGIDWAVERGVHVMNMSWGGGGFSQSLLESLQRAEEAGVVLVAAAGNERSNNDSSASYPANYSIDSLMSVAASDSKDRLADFSNYGRNTVDLMAPGDDILSTIPGNKYASYNGTSMAAPHVAGAAALLLARNPEMTPAEVKEKIMSTVDLLRSVRDLLISGGRLNIDKMIRY